METKYVIFKVGAERYGLPIESVERILPAQPVTRLPRTPKMLLGVFELRGVTIPTLDARLRFEMEENPNAQNFVVVLTPVGRCALRVDLVDGIVPFQDTEIDPNVEWLVQERDDFVQGVGKKGEELTVLVDPERVVPKALRGKIANPGANVPVAA